MIKELMKSIREYKRDSILTPILVSLEVVMEFPIVKDTTPNMMNPRLYTTSYDKRKDSNLTLLSFLL